MENCEHCVSEMADKRTQKQSILARARTHTPIHTGFLSTHLTKLVQSLSRLSQNACDKRSLLQMSEVSQSSISWAGILARNYLTILVSPVSNSLLVTYARSDCVLGVCYLYDDGQRLA